MLISRSISCHKPPIASISHCQTGLLQKLVIFAIVQEFVMTGFKIFPDLHIYTIFDSYKNSLDIAWLCAHEQ